MSRTRHYRLIVQARSRRFPDLSRSGRWRAVLGQHEAIPPYFGGSSRRLLETSAACRSAATSKCRDPQRGCSPRANPARHPAEGEELRFVRGGPRTSGPQVQPRQAEKPTSEPPAICQQPSLTSPQPAPCRFVAICVLTSTDMRQCVDAYRGTSGWLVHGMQGVRGSITSAPLITTAQVAALYCCSTSPRLPGGAPTHAPRRLRAGSNPPTGSRAARRSPAGRAGGE
jgi:hypothetical protein